MKSSWFPLARKSAFLARMKDLFQKYISNVSKIDKTMAYTNRRIRFD